MAGPQYTNCVEASEWRDINYYYIALLLAVTGGAGILAPLSAGFGGLVAAAAFLEALRYVLDFLVNGKLICLHRAAGKNCQCGGEDGNLVCAIGEIVDTEAVGQDKNPIEDLDDDYSVNLALMPFDMNAFKSKGFISSDRIRRGPKQTYTDEYRAYLQALMAIATQPSKPQADLLTRAQIRHGEVAEFGYMRTMIGLTNGDYAPWTSVVGRRSGTPIFGGNEIFGTNETERWADFLLKNAAQRPEKFSVPILHCEFEGSRPRDMLDALEGFPFGSSACKSNWVFKLICRALAVVFAPIALAAVLLAWLRNTEGSTDGAVEGGGTLEARQQIIVRGPWVHDSGHQGWNEIHGVRIVQRIYNVPNTEAEFATFVHNWCERMGETPMNDGTGRPQPTPAATDTAVAQSRPDNQWTHHPFVDGCKPDDPTRPPPLH